MAHDPSGHPSGVRPTTRADRRVAITSEILRIARRQLSESGPGAVSWRGIAREVGLNPASLYTYFESLDDLYTALILESYHSLAAALDAAFEAGLDEAAIDQVLRCAHAYRDWAIAHPAEHHLIFTDVLPGYRAPEGGPTVDAEMAVLRPLVKALARRRGIEADPARPDEAEPGDLDATIGLWGMLHGLVALEVNHHLPLPDQEARFDRVLREAVDHLVPAT